jgi:REP element-mobilizing transposase RayT
MPHWDQPGLVQAITFRLHDSVPVALRAEWEALLQIKDGVEKRARIQAYLDAGYGACYLREARIAEIVQSALLYFDGERYRLLAWVIMPNHVHVLVETKQGYPLDKIVHSWKSYTASRANGVLARTGAFWHREYIDRFIRDERHMAHTVRYIHANPVKAGLVQRAEDWPFSSARLVKALDASVVVPYQQD